MILEVTNGHGMEPMLLDTMEGNQCPSHLPEVLVLWSNLPQSCPHFGINPVYGSMSAGTLPI
eukprot:640322-Karenia_brevis.AAC.1